ncbi:MAG: peptidylprolyl isomerase [Planctomycetota bacterium]|jgi:cyclophilin family peptidyl-prolyl cis-trans isomerase|nr:peptidylprolyl isomerase [Planctomycetota bacterium]
MTDNRRGEVDQALEGVDFETTDYQVELQTSLGSITLDLWADIAPGHCRNLIGLTKIGYYDGIVFHRVIAGFVAQVGCPQGTGTGGPGYTIDAEFNDRLHEAGVLSMARTSDPNSAGSQVFLCLDRVPHLDRQYTAFGKTADDQSLETLLEIGRLATDGQDRPLEEVRIESGRVIESPR